MADFTEIIDGLWMGGTYSPLMPQGFDAVVDCRELSDWTLIGPPFLHLPMIDGSTLPPRYLIDMGCQFIDQAHENGLKVLCHCAQGHNRSGLVMTSYIIRYIKDDAKAAIDLIRSKRPGALTNEVFVSYLLSL